MMLTLMINTESGQFIFALKAGKWNHWKHNFNVLPSVEWLDRFTMISLKPSWDSGQGEPG